MSTGSGVVKVKMEVEVCCICQCSSEDLVSPEEHDAGVSSAGTAPAPLRAMLLYLNNNKVVPNGRLCSNCILRTVDAYNFSTELASKGPPPLSEKIRALRKRLHELTQKIDVFIVVGGSGNGAYSEEDIITVERGLLAASERADAAQEALAQDARGDTLYQCTVCPQTFQRMSLYRLHCGTHGTDSAHWCWSCGVQCASAASLKEHALTHRPPDPLYCQLCGNTFQSSAEKRRHEAHCPSACPACDATFGDRAALRAHVAGSHAGTCATCFVTCGDAGARAAHDQLHARDKHLVCGYRACILRFHTRSNLLAHIRKCHGGTGDEEPEDESTTPVPCPLCPRTFVSAASMKRHARVHQEKEPQHQNMEWRQTENEEKVEYLEVESLEEM